MKAKRGEIIKEWIDSGRIEGHKEPLFMTNKK